MKIVLTGGGTAGHFYPLIAIAEELHKIAETEKLLHPEIFYMSVSPFDKKALFENNITFKHVFSGKLRRYLSVLNIIDVFILCLGTIQALFKLFNLYPDVVISKGGYASVPVVFAARIFRIPIIIHESDAIPGRSNIWAGKFAERIAVSWDSAASFFPKEKTAVVGQPVRRDIANPIKEGAYEYLKLEEHIPVILVLGGSQGAEIINNVILDALPQLIGKYQLIHQTGVAHIKNAEQMSFAILKEGGLETGRYKPFGYLHTLALRMSAGVASLVISRAGSTIFEIASWGLPSIIVPITKSNGDHQRKNAFNYARSGAAIVMEEKNLTPHLLLSEINRIMENSALQEEMKKQAQGFFRKDAALKIAREAIRIALKHEK
ncbi:MAG: UDP-N-acetylglucosamine--N-acetylmuramyl-(pentapeptide) pyrophosphoryl-undecaprenol N-acetylglucosamine transferase [Parcubacteria group bacterium]|nr:UDP-N-acetylglucosamine--N-acetylmuramyl-(pentapeptide) pyrophosphoryl-undecaprenol N-acetylglucosamine transferase [Parcubacteria group bacterium]